jgi:hypothetical protein
MSVILNVQGQIYQTDYDTIIKIPYFKNMLEACGLPKEPIFVNRPPHIFKHILSLAVDPYYQYPAKYVSELDFYCIDSNEIKLYDKNKEILDRLYLIEHRCKNYGCNEIAVNGDKVCKIHSTCAMKDCKNVSLYQKNIKFCRDHLHNPVWCAKYGCDNYTSAGYRFCREHQNYN